jgi:DNA-binding CsgD family transcriptional regulator
MLDYVAANAAGCRVVRAAGVESEMELPFATLHQLCASSLGGLARLPAPQSDALGTAFGITSGAPPDRFLIGVAVLSLLSDSAETQPLVCLVDDAQWLDRESAQVLGFVARRLAAESVVIIFAVRTSIDIPELAGVQELMAGPLEDADARAVLESVISGRLDESVRERILAEARGNPLALVELAGAWKPLALAGGFGLPDSASVSAKVEEVFRRQLTPLPNETRRLLLVAAAEPVGDPGLVLAAAARLGIPAEAAEPAHAARLVEIGRQVRFRHPLVRAVVYREASLNQRRAVHSALAEATDPAVDPDRRAWHLAVAAAAPDEQVAAELERSATRAQARGGLVAAAAFLTRATDLTPDPGRRLARALSAAFASVLAGAFDSARNLLDGADGGPLGDLQRAQIDLMRAQLAFVSSRGTEATPLLLAAARRLGPLDAKMARETYVDAFSAALFGARLNNEGFGLSDVAEAARAAPARGDDDATVADLLLQALIALTNDYATAIAPSREVLRRLCDVKFSSQERQRWLWQGCVIALEMWDDESAYLLSHHSVESARETGTLSELALALSARTPVLVFCGELSAAASTVAQTQLVEEATGIRSAPYGALILAAWRGQASEARGLIEKTIRDAGSRGEGIGLAISQYARAVLSNGLGDYDEAFVAASDASEYREVVVENWGLVELIESAARSGRTDVAADALDRLDHKARATQTAWALGIAARSRALLSEGGRAEALFREAIEHLGQTRVRAELARGHLLYGEWLRRERRRIDARDQLRTAHDMFLAIGMEAFGERARRELLATGEKVRKRSVETQDQLTPQETQIARLAGDGRTNPEIGAQLFLSRRTVEWHLRKVFDKLDVRSRRELAAALLRATHTASR